MRVPLLAGARVVLADAPDDAVVLQPRPPGEPLVDIRAAVRDALRFPLAGEPLDALSSPRARATIVVDPPALPIPGAAGDPRQEAVAGTVDELVRAGVPMARQTILVAAGLGRRPGRRDLDALFSPEFARRFHGRVVVHDVEDESLADVGRDGRVALRVNRALVDADLVVTVSAAETVLHGGPGTLLAAGDAHGLRSAGAYSLLETAASRGWRTGIALERALSEQTPVVGVSLTLNQPRIGGTLHGYPYEADALERVARSPLRLAFGLLPGPLRRRLLQAVPRELSAAAVFAGPPSVAHAEALLRAIDSRAVPLDRPLDAVCIGVPPTTPYLPRERPNPLLVAYLALGMALRLWRDAFPVVEGGTAIILHRFRRHFTHPTQQPYRAFFGTARFDRSPEELAAAEREVAADERSIRAYRAGRSCHPLLPFFDWAACQPALSRLGSVLVAGCRDAHAARQLGFVPTHGLGAALAMAEGRAGRPPRVGFLVAPPYFPVIVGDDT